MMIDAEMYGIMLRAKIVMRPSAPPENILNISNIDIIDGTPLLDIKPFIKEMDCFDMSDQHNTEWLNNKFMKE